MRVVHLASLAAALLIAGAAVIAQPRAAAAVRGQRVFSAGHSFHMFVPPILAEMARAAGIADHAQVGTQSIGGSYVHQHWDLEGPRQKLRPALEAGGIDVVTLSPIYLPDDGIENVARLAAEKNPNVRVLLQEFWLPYDQFDVNYKKKRPAPVDRNARTVDQIRREHGAYFKTMDNHVRALNQKLGRRVLFVVPVGQAVVALRERIIAGTAPGLSQQDDLFTDAIGHPTPPLRALVAYCHFAVIYGRSPVGLPMPSALAAAKNPRWDERLNRLLQELAWSAATGHELSGVTASPRDTRLRKPD